MITRNDYDSDFFGVEIGEINYLESPLSVMRNKLKCSGYKYLTYILPEKINYKHLLLDLGMKLVDKTVDFKIIPNCQPVPKHNIRFAQSKDWKEIDHISRKAFNHSRLHKLKFATPKQIQDYHIQWVHNLPNPIVAICNNDISGFLSYTRNKDIMRIMLIAVNPNYRKLGIATSLITGFLNRATTENIKTACVKTQQTNLPAINLYKKMGFEVYAKEERYEIYPQ